MAAAGDDDTGGGGDEEQLAGWGEDDIDAWEFAGQQEGDVVEPAEPDWEYEDALAAWEARAVCHARRALDL